jgi:hypothetical protein
MGSRLVRHVVPSACVRSLAGIIVLAARGVCHLANWHKEPCGGRGTVPYYVHTKGKPPMSDFFAPYLSDLAALSDGDLSCLLCDAVDFDDDAAFAVIVAEMKARCM